MRRREFIRFGAAGFGAAASARFLVACGGDDDGDAVATTTAPTDATAAPATEPQDETAEAISIRAAGSAAGMGALMTGALGDFAAADNVSIDVSAMSPTDAELAVINGQMDLGLFGILSVVRARDAGHNLVMVAPSFGAHSSLFSTTDNPVTSLADLIGAQLGVLPRVSAQYTDLLQIAAEQDIDLEESFNLTLGDAQLQEGLFLQGELEAFCTFEPNATRLAVDGTAHEVFQFSREWERMFDAPMVSIGWTTTHEFVDAGNGAARLRDANRALVEDLLSDPRLYTENAELFNLEDGGVEVLAERFGALLIPEWDDATLENLQFRLDRAAELDLIETAYDVDDLIDR